jgi:hypothetical protein
MQAIATFWIYLLSSSTPLRQLATAAPASSSPAAAATSRNAAYVSLQALQET